MNGTQLTISQDGQGFDYSVLGTTENILTEVIVERDKIRGLYIRSQETFIEIGHALIAVKELLPHGQFGPWLDAEFGWSQASARRFMQVAEQFPEIAHVERFEPSALYTLSANSVPDDVRYRFVERADSGHTVRLQDVREALGKSRAAMSKADPTAIELVAEIVRLMVTAYDGQGIRTKAGLGSAVKSNLFEQEIDEFPEDEQREIAKIVAAFGEACLKAAAPYLEER